MPRHTVEIDLGADRGETIVKPKLTGRVCQCTVCGEVFNSEAGFNKHRIGTHGVDRRCMTPDAMREAGMALNSRMRWVGSAFPEDSIPGRGEAA